MTRYKKSFFERLTGAINADYDDEIDDDEIQPVAIIKETDDDFAVEELQETSAQEPEVPESEGQLAVDVYQTSDDIIVKTMVAGVRPENLDISITRDMITLKGRREEARHVVAENYFHKELYWGSFSRTIILPQEIDVDSAEATENSGLLMIKLPKLDKQRQTKLKVKMGS